MLSKLKRMLAKYKDIIIYIIFGVLTTVVSFGVHLPLYNWVHLSATVCNVISWLAAVFFAFLTNKPFVFHSYDWSIRVVAPEFLKFIGSRVGSLIVETAILFVFVDMMHLNGNFFKVMTSAVVVVLNYVASRWIVFNKKK